MATFIFREITSLSELEYIFRFRYEVYSQTELNVFLTPNAQNWDYDGYDLHARHLGLFCDNELVGYLRIICKSGTYQNHSVMNFFNREGLAPPIPSAEFPFLTYSGTPKEVADFYKDKSNAPFVEVGRIITSPTYRNMKLAHILTECAMIPCMKMFGNQKGIVAIICKAEFEKYYERYGFKKMLGIDKRNYQVQHQALTAIPQYLDLSDDLTLSSVPREYHTYLQKMMAEYEETGQMDRTV